MKKNLFVSFMLLTVFSLTTSAQHILQGKILDKQDEGAIEMATIRLLKSTDSTLVQGVLTDSKGAFSLSKVKDGKYILEVRYLGYKNHYSDVAVGGRNVILKNIYIEQKANELAAVEVRGMAAQMNVRGDTIEYNTAAYKLAENAPVEDLLKKLPGVTVDADGKVTVNGEEIKKVRIDGKKFFDGDVQMATKNIPVDMIDKVQVIDQKSEMSQLTGFEDENTERIINLTIKANRKKGIFGNASAGAGADTDKDFRYNSNAFVNILDGNAQTAIIAGANNTNEIRSGRGRNGLSGGGGGGITETQNIGVNNNTELSKTLKIGGDGSFNHTTNTSVTSTERESWAPGADSIYNNTSKSTSRKENYQANLRLELEWNIDSLTTMILQPTLGYTKGFSNSSNDNAYFEGTDSISWGGSGNNSTSDSKNAGMNLIINRKSKEKKGRTLTLNLGGSLSNSNSEGFNKSEKFTNVNLPPQSIDQRNTVESNTYNTNLRLSYVEPLFNLKNFLELKASFSSNSRTSDKMQYNKGLNGEYNMLDSVYSNNFKNLFLDESFELNYRHQEANYNYMLGMMAEPSQTYSTNYYVNGDILDRPNNVFNISPSAQFRYNFGRKKFARLEYRGRTNQPSIEQMQPVKNNDNLMQEPVGNPLLSPAFEQSLRLMYSSFNATRFSSFSAGLNGSFVQNALVTNSIYDKTGKEFNQTVNSERAPLNASANVMYNTPLVKNRLQFNTRTEVNYSKHYGYSDRTATQDPYLDSNKEKLRLGYLSDTRNWGANQNLALTFTTDIIEIGARGSVRYSCTENNLNNNLKQETWDWTGAGNINLHLPYSLNIANDISYTTREGYSSFNQNELVWNASIDKSVFNKKGTVSLKMYDILQQRLNIRENIGDNFRTLSRSNMLPSYFMLSFTYKIAKFGGGATGEDMFRGNRGGRGGYGGGFGGEFGGPPGM
jgi:hypothetical protein